MHIHKYAPCARRSAIMCNAIAACASISRTETIEINADAAAAYMTIYDDSVSTHYDIMFNPLHSSTCHHYASCYMSDNSVADFINCISICLSDDEKYKQVISWTFERPKLSDRNYKKDERNLFVHLFYFYKIKILLKINSSNFSSTSIDINMYISDIVTFT